MSQIPSPKEGGKIQKVSWYVFSNMAESSFPAGLLHFPRWRQDGAQVSFPSLGTPLDVKHTYPGRASYQIFPVGCPPPHPGAKH